MVVYTTEMEEYRASLGELGPFGAAISAAATPRWR